MRWLTEIWLRFRGLVWRTRLDRDLDAEMEFHLQMRQRELEESGMPPQEARHAASRRFGNRTLIQERGREMFGFGPLERLFNDIKFALRTLRRSPLFSVIRYSRSRWASGRIRQFSRYWISSCCDSFR
jgi:hypothetical protein